jgi:hypothetical protein
MEEVLCVISDIPFCWKRTKKAENLETFAVGGRPLFSNKTQIKKKGNLTT